MKKSGAEMLKLSRMISLKRKREVSKAIEEHKA